MVSAALRPEGIQRTVILLAMTKPACWYASAAIASEYAMVLARPELKIRRGLRLQLLQLIENRTHVVRPTRLRQQVTTDPADSILVECTDSARARLLDYGQSAALPRLLEEHKDHQLE